MKRIITAMSIITLSSFAAFAANTPILKCDLSSSDSEGQYYQEKKEAIIDQEGQAKIMFVQGDYHAVAAKSGKHVTGRIEGIATGTEARTLAKVIDNKSFLDVEIKENKSGAVLICEIE